MATDANNPGVPEQEPTAEPAPAPGNDDVNGADGEGRTIALPAPFVENLPPEILENLPPEIRANLRSGSGETITHASITSMSMMMLGRVVNPIADKVTAQHITEIIGITSREADYADRRSEREYSDRKHARNWVAALVGMVILAVTAVIIILIYQGILDFLREMAMIIIPALGGIGAGVAIGFRMGIGYANSRNRQ